MKWVGQYIQNLKATFKQGVTLDSTLTFDSVALTGIQTSAESFVDDDVSIMTSAAIDDRINTAVTAEDLDVAADSGTAAVDLNSQSLTVTGGTNITTSATGQAVTVNLDGTLAGPLEIEQGASGGAAALLVDNNDVDQPAIDIEAANTTVTALRLKVPDLTSGNAIYVNADSLTTGAGIKIDSDDALTTNATKSLAKIDYDKAGVTASGQASITTGLDINMADAATNHASGAVTMIGAQVDVDSANAQGTITQKGLILNVAADGVGDAATTSGIEMEVMDGGTDIKMMSHADTADYCTIGVTTSGATTITTVDGGAAAAHFEVAADGDITLDSAGQIKLEPVAGNNILLDGTVTVDGGSVTGITTLGVDSVSLTAVQTSGESFVDNDTSIMTSAAAHDRFASRGYFEFKGYGTSDGTNYDISVELTDNQAPFQHDTSTGSDGLTAQSTSDLIRAGGIVMPHTGVLKKFTGWVTSQGTGTVDVGIFKVTPVDNNASNLTPVLLVNEQITAAGNTKMRSFSETSSFDAGFTAGDIIYSAVNGGTASKVWYMNSILEVEWS